MVSSSAYGFGSGAVTKSRGCAGLVSGIRQQLILQMDVAAGVLSERQKRDYQGARGKRQYVYADEAAQYWLVSNARLLQKTILASIRSGMVRNRTIRTRSNFKPGAPRETGSAPKALRRTSPRAIVSKPGINFSRAQSINCPRPAVRGTRQGGRVSVDRCERALPTRAPKLRVGVHIAILA